MEAVNEVVRKADRDRYLCALYAPAEKRRGLLSLYAFNAELARIRDVSSEPMPAEIRLQWWRDALTADAQTTTAGHPVAEALIRTIEEHDLPLAAFENMIDARRFDLYNDPMPSRNDLEGYCGETAASLIQLSSLVLDSSAARENGNTAGHAGCAQAITGLLALLPIHRARKQCYIPSDMLAAVGATAADLYPEDPDRSALRAVAAMIALAREHLRTFEKEAVTLPTSLRPAYLALSFVPAWLKKIEGAGSSVFSVPITVSPLRRNLSVFYRAAMGWRS